MDVSGMSYSKSWDVNNNKSNEMKFITNEIKMFTSLFFQTGLGKILLKKTFQLIYFLRYN